MSEDAYVLGDDGEFISVLKSERVLVPIFELGYYSEMVLKDFKENGLNASIYSSHNQKVLNKLTSENTSLKDIYNSGDRDNIKVTTPNEVFNKLLELLDGMGNEQLK